MYGLQICNKRLWLIAFHSAPDREIWISIWNLRIPAHRPVYCRLMEGYRFFSLHLSKLVNLRWKDCAKEAQYAQVCSWIHRMTREEIPGRNSILGKRIIKRELVNREASSFRYREIHMYLWIQRFLRTAVHLAAYFIAGRRSIFVSHRCCPGLLKCAWIKCTRPAREIKDQLNCRGYFCPHRYLLLPGKNYSTRC